MKRLCENCRHYKSRSKASYWDERSDGRCTLDPVWIDADRDHYCGQHKWNEEATQVLREKFAEGL